ncbi:MAG TPA: DNA gyrase subunit A, partial [Candidatus Diapherotrites archaeon]|nr:DNA gyrase subunit A [Candidatus Diapherotrites archaeon]
METKDIVSITKDLYYDYAKYVNLGGRTIPLVYDTLKTVQRRVLLSAYELTKSGDFVKSAKIVGHTIGSYHPHGD